MAAPSRPSLVVTAGATPAPIPIVPPVVVPPASSGNDYYNALVAHPKFWKGYPLRSQAEIDQYKVSGANYGLAYDAAHDALKTSIPVIRSTPVSITGTLLNPLSASDLLVAFKITSWDSAVLDGGLLKIDQEVMLVKSVDITNKTATIATRGFGGTTAASHNAGALVYPGTNSLQNQMRMPLGTSDGHSYLFTWDVMYTDSWLNAGIGMKAFQLSSPAGQIWLETQMNTATRYTPYNLATEVGGVSVRSYNQLGGVADWMQTDGNHLGPIVTKADIIQPMTNVFVYKPNTWVRLWQHIQQRANDYDPLNVWAADKDTGPVRVFTDIPLSVRPTGKVPNSIGEWWIELNTSQDRFVRGNLRDLDTYVRNFAVLQDVALADVPALLSRPR